MEMKLNMVKRFLDKLLNKYTDQKPTCSELKIILNAQRQYSILKFRNDSTVNHASGIVFSMDRALQLHALLGSYLDQVEKPQPLKIIYRASSREHNEAYLEVFQEYDGYVLVKRQEKRLDFKAIMIDMISNCNSENIFFLVDDNMFVEPVDLRTFASLTSLYCVPSLRMGQNLSRSYMLQCRQALPQLCVFDTKSSNEQLLAWIWKCGEFDWNYPLSVDGHFFQRNEILTLVKTLDFDSPNRFEEQLQRFHMAFNWRLGICYEKSRIINIPYNKVQEDIENLHGSVHQESMLKMWNDGYRIDRKSYYGIVNESAHQELPLRLTERLKEVGGGETCRKYLS